MTLQQFDEIERFTAAEVKDCCVGMIGDIAVDPVQAVELGDIPHRQDFMFNRLRHARQLLLPRYACILPVDRERSRYGALLREYHEAE
jgi:hypothetical protein